MRRIARMGCLAVLCGAVLCLAGCCLCPLGPLVALFEFAPEAGGLPVTVTFDATSSSGGGRGIERYEWDFGDGNEAVGRVVRHKFERPPGEDGEIQFRVTLTIIRNLEPEDCNCPASAGETKTVAYGVTRPLNVEEGWEVKEWYYGTRIEGYVQVVGPVRVAHGRVMARFFRGPDHELVQEAPHFDLFDLAPEERRKFSITSTLRHGQFDWVELRTEAIRTIPWHGP